MEKTTVILLALAIIALILLTLKAIKKLAIIKEIKTIEKEALPIAKHIEGLQKTMVTASGYTAVVLKDFLYGHQIPKKYEIHLKTVISKMIVDINNRCRELRIENGKNNFPINLTIDKLTGMFIVGVGQTLYQMNPAEIHESKKDAAAEIIRLAKEININLLPE